MKLVIVTIATLLSLSLGGGTFSPCPFDSGLFTFSEQSTEQTTEASADVTAQILKLNSADPFERSEAACKLGERNVRFR